MSMHRLRVYGVIACGAFSAALASEPTSSPTYAIEQAAAGKATYASYCARCHGDNLQGAEAPAISGAYFQSKWAGKSVYDLFARLKTTMPAPAPGSLSDEDYTNLVALILQKTAVAASPKALSSDPGTMKAMSLPPSAIVPLEPGITLPPAPQPLANPLDHFSNVTAQELKNPPDQDWLRWRRTEDAQGFSPLTQITKHNVSRLRVAWSWPLPSGPDEATPLVHQGTLYVFGYGDVVQALNAATGDLLWEYRRMLPKGSAPDFKKALALYGQNLYLATSDGYLVALDAKTGELVWESLVEPAGTFMSGGPLLAQDKVIIGTNLKYVGDYHGTQGNVGDYHGGRIIAFDAATGKEAWRFQTIPGPQDPGGNTWNGLPLDKRSGASVWVPGSYDSDLDLVFFGTGQTYDTGPLRNRVKGSASSNDAIYTDTTLALKPETGQLIWYYQHMPNDQWDLDWAFERQIVMLPVAGRPEKVLVTAGKAALHDILDAKSGKYLFSIDAGIQNFITGVDPKTGAKTYDAAKIPGGGSTPYVCPHSGGAKNWLPSSFNPVSKILFVPMVEACMTMPPVPSGEAAILTTGVRLSLVPREHSDGLYGRLQAFDLETRRTLWTDRQRAPRTSGALDTAGGVVFAGSLDRMINAYDDATGKKLWSARLSEVPSSAPISYAVEGRQYVAVVVGMGGSQSMAFMPLVPEIKSPIYRTSSLWVFELPDSAGSQGVD